MDAFMHVHLHLPCTRLLCRLSLPLSSFGRSTSSERSGLIITVHLSKCPNELLEHLWRALFFKKLLLKYSVTPYSTLRYALEATSHFCVVLSRFLTYKAAACWTRGHLQIDCNWTKPLTSAVASWGMWWKHQGYVCWVCEQMSLCTDTSAVTPRVNIYASTYYLSMANNCTNRKGCPQMIRALEKSAPAYLNVWGRGASLQIWCHGPDLITRSFFLCCPRGLVIWFPITPWYLFGMLGTSAERVLKKSPLGRGTPGGKSSEPHCRVMLSRH